MIKKEEAVRRARALIGTPFVAQGRNPAIGLDCVGLIVAAFDLDPHMLPDDYRLGGPHRAAILALAKRRFRRVPRTQVRAGDVLLLRPGRAQWHLGLWTGEGIVHADLAVRRTVERPGPLCWPLAAVLRPRTRYSKGS